MPLEVRSTEIDGLWVVDLDVHRDTDRAGASFREAYQAAKLGALAIRLSADPDGNWATEMTMRWRTCNPATTTLF